MKDNTSLIVKKENIFQKIIKNIKNKVFKNKENVKKEPIIVVPKSIEESKSEFINNIKVTIDTEINMLKIKLENGEIKAIDLTDEQIDKLQEIYDKEIEKKKMKLSELLSNKYC